MNVADEFLKGRKSIRFPPGCSLVVHSENNNKYHCTHVKGQNQIIIPNASSIRHLNNTRLPGLLVRAPLHQKVGSITTSIVRENSCISQVSAISSECFSPLLLPSRFQAEDPFAGYALSIRSEVDFLIASPPRISRKSFIELAKGYGVEIGPGPSPQIFNSTNVKVKYIEERAAEEWKKLYKNFNQTKDSLWTSYQIGTASKIDELDGSLDFIFASHVFEHLHNPLGHLKYWATKLRIAGLVLLVIPEQSGTKDHQQDYTNLSKLVSEETAGAFEPTTANYLEWGKGRDLAYIQELIAQKASIHVHTYDYESIIPLVEELLLQNIFSDYILDYLPCTKDFLLALRK